MVSKTLNETVQSIRQKSLRKMHPKTSASYWIEKDLLNMEVVDTGVVILPTRGCAWARGSGCTMCGYIYESGDLSEKDLLDTFSKALKGLQGVPYLKIFTSGSFFDPLELSPSLQKHIIKEAHLAGVKSLQVESRPGFLSSNNLKRIVEERELEVEIGIGLETSNDLLREHTINKGFTFKDYTRAVSICKDLGIHVKTYLLLKPPFILERESISDIVRSTLDASEVGSDKVSINPMNIQKGTLVELLYKRGEYKPPWIWSLIESLKELCKKDIPTTILSHPSGGGNKRGIHNCGVCDTVTLERVQTFSLTQDISVFNDLQCECIDHWRDQLLLE